jgi:hypothetical protein
MEKNSIAAIVRALNDAKVRYLIVGGLAVVAHGYLRFTADLDLILDLREDNLRRAIPALAGLSYRPLVPVAAELFVYPTIRAQWVREKGLTVFSLVSPHHPATTVDHFVEAPFPFDPAHAAAACFEVAPGVKATFVSREGLLQLKRQAGRAKDLEDINRLEELGEKPSNGGRTHDF